MSQLDALAAEAPTLHTPLGLGLAGVTLMGGAAAVTGLLWGLGTAAPFALAAAFLVALPARAGLERLFRAGAADLPYESALLGIHLPGVALEAGLLAALVLVPGDRLVPGPVAWPLAAWLALTGGVLVVRAWLRAGLVELAGVRVWRHRQAPPPTAPVTDAVGAPVSAGLVRLAAGLAMADGSALSLLLAVLYGVFLVTPRARGARILPSQPLDELRLVLDVFDTRPPLLADEE